MILHWILLHLSHLLSFGTIALAATVMPDLTAGSADLGGDTSTTTETTEETVDGGETEPTEETVDGDGTQEEVEEDKDKERIDWKTVPGNVKAHLQAIAKTDPKLGNLLQNAVYTSQSMLREFPGGIKEVKALKQSIENIGGIDQALQVKQEYDTFVEQQEELDRKAASGDPSTIDTFLEIAGDGFNKLMPVALDRWAASNPKEYQHIMSQVIIGALQDGNVVSDLNMAWKMLNLKNEEATKVAIEHLQKVSEWANNMNQVATKPPEKPRVDPNIEAQQRQIEEEKTKIFNDKFSSQFGAWRNGRLRDEIALAVGKGKQLTSVQMNTLANWVVNDIQQILTSDEDYMKTLEKVYGTRDISELLKFTKSRTDKLLANSVKKGYRQLFANFSVTKKTATTKEKTTAATTTTTSGKGTTTTTTTNPAWKKVDVQNAPKPQDIDNNKTDFRMKFNKQAILKNGQRVYWGDKVPQ